MTTTTNFQKSLDSFCKLSPSPVNKTTGKHAEVSLYGIIGSKRINAHTVQQAIDKAGKPDTIRFNLNTIGGSFAEGLAIHNIIKQQSAATTVKVMGYALSMGSLLMMAADHVECASNGLVMMHQAQGFTVGDVRDHEQAIAVLKKHDQILINAYRPRLNKSDDDIMKLLQTETWYSASEALAAGLIDAVIDPVDFDPQEAEQGSEGVESAHFRNPPQAFRQAAGSLYS